MLVFLARALARTVLVVFAACLLFGCRYPQGNYARSGVFQRPEFSRPEGEAPVGRALRCADVGVRNASTSASGVTLWFAFGNPCATPTRLDLGAITVEATFEDGSIEALRPTTQGEARSGVLDAYASGRDVMTYAATGGRDTQTIRSVCADLSRATIDAPEPGAPVCVDIVGRGAVASAEAASSAWRASAIPFSLGYDVAAHGFDLRGQRLSGLPSGRTGATAPLRSAVALSIDFGGRVTIVGPLYVGAEVQAGGADTARDATLGPGVTAGGVGIYAGGGALVGAQSPRLGPLTARAELFAGGFLMDPDVELDVPTCDDHGRAPCPNLRSWLVEPRARLETWLTPYASLDAWGGVGIIEHGDLAWSTGLGAAFHLRGYDGR